VHRVKAMARGELYSFPINLDTLNRLYGVRTPREAEQHLISNAIPHEPDNLETWVCSKLGSELYELFFKGYTMKQYGCHPSELPASIAARLPIRLTFDDRYFVAKYCAMPLGGYTKFVKRMLDHDNIDVAVGTDFYSLNPWRNIAKQLVFCGRPDKLACDVFCKLPYLSMSFKHESKPGDHQGIGVINWCDESVPYLRSVQPSHFYPSGRKHSTTVDMEGCTVAYDYPSKDGEPYYPIAARANVALHQKYEGLLQQDGVTLGGRLGEYRYYDMDQAIASALVKARALCG
jgi:UDP-galactopyranose mutase